MPLPCQCKSTVRGLLTDDMIRPNSPFPIKVSGPKMSDWQHQGFL